MNEYYILRVGNFATNANTKIYYSLFTIMLCIEEYLTINKIDCFNIMINSTVIWSIIEFILHVSKTRVIRPMNLYILNNKYQLPMQVGVFLQGFQEGGCITTIGLYFGDRIFIRKYFLFLHFIILFIIWNVSTRKLQNKISSKRQVNTYTSIALMSSVSTYNIIKLYQNPSHIQRAINMLFVMIYISSYWTFIAWYKGFRKVRVYQTICGERMRIINKYDTINVLGYDVIFEIGMAYLFFYCYYIESNMLTV